MEHKALVLFFSIVCFSGKNIASMQHQGPKKRSLCSFSITIVSNEDFEKGLFSTTRTTTLTPGSPDFSDQFKKVHQIMTRPVKKGRTNTVDSSLREKSPKKVDSQKRKEAALLEQCNVFGRGVQLAPMPVNLD